MSSYKPVPPDEPDKDFQNFSFYPRKRTSSLNKLGPFLPLTLIITEIFIFSYYKNSSNEVIYVALISLSISFSRIIYIFQISVNTENYSEKLIWTAKFITTFFFVFCFKIPLFEFHLAVTMSFIVSCSLLYLCKFKYWSWQEICQYCSENPALGPSFAHGTYEGYYGHILPKIQEEITKFAKDNEVPLKKLIILLPHSCSTLEKLKIEEDPENIKISDYFVIHKDNGGTISRPYKIPQYRVKRQNRKEFFCFFDLPSSLSNMKNIAKYAKQQNDNSEYLDEQYQGYVHCIKDCLKKDLKCTNSYLVVDFNDIDEDGSYKFPLSRVLELIVDGKLNSLHS